MLGCLPEDVIVDILVDFADVNLIDISHLDVAACNHSIRPDLLVIFKRLTFHGAREVSNHNRGYLLEWIAHKGVNLTEIRVLAADLADFSAHMLRGLQVRSVATIGFGNMPEWLSALFTNGVPPVKAQARVVKAFLDHFPCLTAVDCSGWDLFINAHLRQFRGLPLVSLNILAAHDTSVNSATAAKVICSMSASLQDLRCTLNDQALCAVADCCHSLKYLAMNCKEIKHAARIERLCASNPGLLELSLKDGMMYDLRHDDGDGINTNLIHAITTSCKHLQSVIIKSCGEITSTFVRTIFASCPDIGEIDINSTIFTTQWRSGVRTVQGIAFCLDPDELLNLCNGVELPIDQITCGFASVKDHFIRFAADAHGHSLKVLKTSCVGISNETMQYAVVRCTQLEEVGFRELQWGPETLDILKLLPSSITAIHLLECSLSDSDLLSLLLGLRTREMRRITLKRCSELTDICLGYVADCFPILEELSLDKTSISKECLFELISSGKLTVRRLYHPDALWLKQALTGVLFPPARYTPKEYTNNSTDSFKHWCDFIEM